METITFKFKRNNIGNHEITYQFDCAGRTWPEVLEDVCCFLKAIGYFVEFDNAEGRFYASRDKMFSNKEELNE